MNRTEVKTIDDLPKLPFEQILSYLSLKDRLKSRAVSRGWYHRIDSFKVKSLCYSPCPSGFIYGKRRWVSGAFAQNFVSSARFEWFFSTFGQSILSNLKQLRLCDLDLKKVNATAFFQILNSFGQLEELGLFGFYDLLVSSDPRTEFELNLLMLNSLQLEKVQGIKTLTLDAPRLQKVKVSRCPFLRLVIVHGESVERLLTDQFVYTAVKNLKSLQYLYIGSSGRPSSAIDSTLLSGLDQLKEIHLNDPRSVEMLFEQKQRNGRTDLKIYLGGLLLNGPEDPAIDFSSNFKEFFVHLAENPSRLADEIPFSFDFLSYSAIERVDLESTIDLLSRYTNFDTIVVREPVQDIERFLDVLKNCDHIAWLRFQCDQPQDLFDRLPEHSAVQELMIQSASDFRFLFRLNHLTRLDVYCSIDAKTIRKLFEGLPFLLFFGFEYNNERAEITSDSRWTHPKRFKVHFDEQWTNVPDLNAAIQFIFETSQNSCCSLI